MVVDDGARIDADAVINSGQQIARMHGILQRRRCGLVGLAVDVAALDAGARDEGGIAVWPVIAAIVVVFIAARADAALRTAAEFTDGDHERFAHYVDKSKVTEAMVLGTPVVALCGKVWVPSRDPKNFPVCPMCQELYEMSPEERMKWYADHSSGE